MFDYETGIFFAFLLWLYNAIMIVVSVNSRWERNLNRIGQRLSWLTLTEADGLRRPITIYCFENTQVPINRRNQPPLCPSRLAQRSTAIATIIYRRAKDSGAPQAVREFRWKMKNADLTFDQLVKEMMKISEDDSSKFEEFRTTIVNELEERGLPHG